MIEIFLIFLSPWSRWQRKINVCCCPTWYCGHKTMRVVWASPGGNFSIGGGRQGPAPAPSVVVHSTHPRQKPASALNPWTINTGGKDGEDEEGEGAPLVQGGEGQGAKEVLRPNRWKLTSDSLGKNICVYMYLFPGKPRGRPKKPPGEAKPKYVPTGAPRGRKPGQKNSKW